MSNGPTIHPTAPAGAVNPSSVPEELGQAEIWSDELLARQGLAVEDVPFVSIGGGLGSLAMLDTLRIASVPAAQLRTVTDLDSPEETYRLLAENSQIPEHERLRSDSRGCRPSDLLGDLLRTAVDRQRDRRCGRPVSRRGRDRPLRAAARDAPERRGPRRPRRPLRRAHRDRRRACDRRGGPPRGLNRRRLDGAGVVVGSRRALRCIRGDRRARCRSVVSVE